MHADCVITEKHICSLFKQWLWCMISQQNLLYHCYFHNVNAIWWLDPVYGVCTHKTSSANDCHHVVGCSFLYAWIIHCAEVIKTLIFSPNWTLVILCISYFTLVKAKIETIRAKLRKKWIESQSFPKGQITICTNFAVFIYLFILLEAQDFVWIWSLHRASW